MKLSVSLLLSFFLFSSCNFSPDENKTDANEKQSQTASGFSSGKSSIDENENQDHVVIITEGGIGVGASPPGAAGRGKYQIMPPSMVGRMVPAMMENDLRTVREMLVSGNYGWTELMEAVYNNDPAKVERLIKSGADVNAKTYGGMAALNIAVQLQNMEILKKLVTAGASPAEKGGLAARAPFAFAVEKGNEPIARLVLEAGVDIKREWPALANAVKSDMTEIVELMLEKGIDLKSRDKVALYQVRRALNASIDNENKKMALLLIKHGADVNAVDNFGETPLSYAAKAGRSEMVKLLLENGVDLNRHGEKSIKAALLNGKFGIVDMLMENGVALNLDKAFAAEILMEAANTGNGELMAYLFDKNVEIPGEDMEKAVENAVEKGNIAIAISVAKKLESPARPKAASLIYFHDQKDKCEIKIFDTNTRSSKLIYTTEKCPDIIKDKIFLDDDAKSLLVAIGSTIQEIVYGPVVKIGPVINLPFKVNSRVYPDKDLPYAQMLINQLNRAGHLSDGRLGVINYQEHPVGGMEYELLLWIFDKGKWTMVKEKHCRAFGYCTFEELGGHSLKASRADTEITHPSIVFNPYIVGGGVLESSGSLFPNTGRDGEWRYITFSVNERETTVYFNAVESSHSSGLLTFQLFVKTQGNSKPVQLTDSQCSTAIEGRYLLLHKYFGEGMHLIDLETGETLLSAKDYAAWLYN